jgi:hypothetical protein
VERQSLPGMLTPPQAADVDGIRRYARDTVFRLHDVGVYWLDRAADQKYADTIQAFTDLGRAYNEAAATCLAICERFGYLPEPINPSASDSS